MCFYLKHKRTYLEKLRRKINIYGIFNLKQKIYCIFWYQTLYSYINSEYKETVAKLWKILENGIRLSEAKYLEKTKDKFNFDNNAFFVCPSNLKD